MCESSLLCQGSKARQAPKELVERVDVIKILERPECTGTKIPKPRCVRELRAVLLQNQKLLEKLKTGKLRSGFF